MYASNDQWIGGRVSDNRKPTPRDTSWPEALARIPDRTIRVQAGLLVGRMQEAGIRIPLPAKSEKVFTLVKKKAYFNWDPDGKISHGMDFPKMKSSLNPGRIVVTEEDPDVCQRLDKAGFSSEASKDGTRTYRVFDLSPRRTDHELDEIVRVLRELAQAQSRRGD
jgi:hypothetical protein